MLAEVEKQLKCGLSIKGEGGINENFVAHSCWKAEGGPLENMRFKWASPFSHRAVKTKIKPSWF